MQTSFFLGRERLVPKVSPLMMRWREKLYIMMQRNQTSATDFFKIPPGRVVELGTQIEI
jgi:KUP system potassium uptake protein